ncbi:MAG: hypothetical protein SFY80_06575 [Verrucomicrobiota bacterium]|nr:hypothetical protein [Verrucomicrobiota bacterium]
MNEIYAVFLFRVVLLLLCSTSTVLCEPIVPFPNQGPAGIFVIGDTHAVQGEVAKFDFDFISGYTLRVPWADLESWDSSKQIPLYDFSRITSTLEELRSRGKRMTLEILVSYAPAYILTLPGTSTWNNPHPKYGGKQVVPWDTNALDAYHKMLQALASYSVPGTPWVVGDHPTLETVDSPIVGLQGLREMSGVLVAHPDYDRNHFIEAVVDSVSFSRMLFSNKFGFLALFSMEDQISTPRLDDAVYARLMQEFNQSGKPSLGFFQETLSDTGPKPESLGSLLSDASSHTYIMFQALRPWALRPDEPRPTEIASGTPFVALNNAWKDYHATYVELYGADLLAVANAEPMRKWNRFMNGANSMGRGLVPLTLRGFSNTSISLSWPSDPLLNYQIWTSPNLNEWALLLLEGSTTSEVIIPYNTTAPSVYFRLGLLPP